MIGQPDHAAGNRGGSAKPVLLFDQPDRGTGFVRRQRCGQARCTGTDDQNICLAVDYGISPRYSTGKCSTALSTLPPTAL